MGKNSKKIKKKKSGLAAAQPKSAATSQKYSIDDILDKADENIDRFEFSMSQKFCERALEFRK